MLLSSNHFQQCILLYDCMKEVKTWRFDVWEIYAIMLIEAVDVLDMSACHCTNLYNNMEKKYINTIH